MMNKTTLVSGALVLTGMLVACGSQPPKKQEALSLSTDPASVAAEYVALENGTTLPRGGNVMITSCNVAFGKKTRAGASTQAGALYRESADKTRVEAKVSSEMVLEGVDDSTLERLTSLICQDAKQALVEAGYNVISGQDNAQYQELQANGKPSPHEWDYNKSEYAVFAPSGYSVWDNRFVGVAGGLMSAFKAAKGNSSDQLLTGAVNAKQATGVAMHFVVAFASSEGDKGRKSMFTRDDTAEVSHDTRMMVTGDINFMPAAQLDCWERFGKTECMPKGKTPRVVTRKPLIAAEQAYVRIHDIQSTGSKIGEGLANTLNMLSALAGSSGTSTIDIEQLGVEVDPVVYERVAREYSRRFMKMAMSVR